MRWKLFLFVSLVFVLVTCDEPVETHLTLSGSWQLYALEDLDTQELEYEPAHLPQSIILTFSDNGKNGSLNGQTITNEILGKYEIKANNVLFIKELNGTLFGEPEWGDKFWEAIRDVRSFKRNKGELEIYYQGDKRRMLWKEQESQP